MKKILIFIFLIISLQLNAFEQIGTASWYGPKFHGKKTANGEIFNSNDFTAAHLTLPFGSIVKVISLENDKSIIVRINDKGPFVKNRIIDLSKAAAEKLDMLKTGTMKVKIILLELGDNKYHRYSKQKYQIQIASFTDEKKALNIVEQLKGKNFDIKLKKVMLANVSYNRVIIDNLNYYELQIYRVKLHNEGISDYLIIKK